MLDHSPYKHVLILLVDGARPDVLEQELSSGNLPMLSRYFAQSGTCQSMVTAFPSTTGPAYLPYLTGCFPGTCNVPGIRWFDREAYARHGWGPWSIRSYVGLESYLFNRDVRSDIPTLWQNFSRGKSVLNIVTKGLKSGGDLTQWSKSFLFYYGHITDRWAYLDGLAEKHLLALVKKRDFDLGFVVFPAVDEYSHQTSPFHDRVRQAYREFDATIGRLMTGLEDAGIKEETLIMIVSDHGHSSTSTHFDVGPWLEHEKKKRTLYHSNILKFKFEAVSMVSGNGMTHLYFKNEKGWAERTTFEELGHASFILDELRFRPEVDVVAVQGADGRVCILTELGHGSFQVEPRTRRVFYEFHREDPLGLFTPQDPLLKEGFSLDEGLALTFNSRYPDIFMQLHQIFNSPRTGDVIVTAKNGFDLREKFEHPIHRSSHGSLSREHMLVPLLSNHPIREKFLRSVDIAPMILRLTGREVPAGMDGRQLL